MGNIALRLTRMTREHCAQSIETALNDLAGVAAENFSANGSPGSKPSATSPWRRS